jgi:hypothetical protein
MKREFVIGVALGLALLLAAPAAAQQLYVYPSQGQDSAQQNRDQGECHSWSIQQSGYNPANPPRPPASAYEAPQGGALRGAARGATVGAIGGAIGGSAGKGARIGAASGALMGGMRRRGQKNRQAQDQANYQAYVGQLQQSYNRAYATCLQGRGYTVN